MLRTAILALMPSGWRAAIEADSRRWHTLCPTCGHQSTIWDLGGMRFKATGDKRTGIWCPACRKFGFHRMERR